MILTVLLLGLQLKVGALTLSIRIRGWRWDREKQQGEEWRRDSSELSWERIVSWYLILQDPTWPSSPSWHLWAPSVWEGRGGSGVRVERQLSSRPVDRLSERVKERKSERVSKVKDVKRVERQLSSRPGQVIRDICLLVDTSTIFSWHQKHTRKATLEPTWAGWVEEWKMPKEVEEIKEAEKREKIKG